MTAMGGEEVVGRQYVEIWPTLRRWASEFRSQTAQINADTRRQLEPVARTVEQHNGRIIASTVGMVARAGRTIVTAGGAAAVAAGAIGLKAAASTEMATTAFTQLLGGVKQSQRYMSDLAKFAAATPFEMPGLINASRQLLGAGASAKSVIPTLTAWGNAAGSLGIQQEDFNGILLAVSQSMNKQKVQNEELMQITERGIPVYPLLAAAMGKPVAKIQQLASEGKLLSKDVLPLLERQMNKQYGQGLLKQSQTLLGLWSTFKDTFTQGMSAAIQPALPMIKNVLLGATNDMTAFFMGIQNQGTKTRSIFNQTGLGIRAFFVAIREGDVSSLGFVGLMEKMGTAVHNFYGGLTGHGPIEHFGGRLNTLGLGLRALVVAFREGDVTSSGFVGHMESAGVAVRGFQQGLKGHGQLEGFTGWTNTAGLGLRALVMSFKEGDVTSRGFVGVMERIGSTTRHVFDYVDNVAIPTARQWFTEFRVGTGDAGSTHEALVSIGQSFRTLAPAIQQARQELPSLSDALTVGATLLAFLADHIDTVTKLMPAIVAGFIAFRVAQLGANVAATLSLPTKIAEIVINRQLARSNLELVRSRREETAAIAADTTAHQTGLITSALERFYGVTRRGGADVDQATAKTGLFSGALARLRGHSDATTASTGRISGAFRGIGSTVAGAIGSITPFGAVLTVATAAVSFFAFKKQEAVQRVEDFVQAIQRDSGALGENTRALVAQRLEQAGSLQAAQTLGLSLDDVTDAALGNSAAMDRIGSVMQVVHGRYQDFVGTGQAVEQGLGDQESAAQQLQRTLGGTNNELQTAVEKQRRMSSATAGATGSVRDQGSAAGVTAGSISGMTNRLSDLVNIESNAERSSLDVSDAIARMTSSVNTNGRSLEVNSQKGRDNRRVVLDAIDAANRHADSVFRQTGDINLARRAFDSSIGSIQRQADKLHLNKREVDALINSVGRLPARRSVDVEVLVRAKTIVDGRVNFGGGAGRAGGSTAMAGGGWVDGFSPHDTADNIGIRATGDEFMVRRRSARWWRRQSPGFLEWINSRGRDADVGGDAGTTRVAFGRRLGFAAGGSIPNIQSFIRGTDRLPYVWGAAGPGSYDCSGLVGAVYGMLTGRGGGHGQRYFTTDTVGPQAGLRPGLGTFSIGVTPARGHMVGSLGSLKFEARSTKAGIITGSGATPPTAMARHYTLGGGPYGVDGLTPEQSAAIMRRVTPIIVSQVVKDLGVNRDSGGDLLPGQFARNVSGGRERVLNSRERREYEAAGGVVQHHWHVQGITPFTEKDAVEIFERHATLNYVS